MGETGVSGWHEQQIRQQRGARVTAAPDRPATPAAFTRETQRKLTALRVTAYSLATCFMIVMVVRGVWITRNQLEAEVDRSAAAAAIAMETMAGVNHELNNPLAAVIGQTALLAEDLDGSKHAGRIAKIRHAADRCARIVQSFLAMARQKLPEYRSVTINHTVRAAVELTEYQLRAANVVLDLRLDEALPDIEADPDQLHQVIANLLTNARQALEEVSGERRITITTTHAGEGIRSS